MKYLSRMLGLAALLSLLACGNDFTQGAASEAGIGDFLWPDGRSPLSEAGPTSDGQPGHDSGADRGVVLDQDVRPDQSASPDITATAVCGDGTRQGAELCDDGNLQMGDYCSADCLQVTGRCGDGIKQSNESCDDGLSSGCATYHDGGDGSCVPPGSCAAGYTLTSAGTCQSNPTGLSTPCQNGPGWTLFRFHWSSNSTSPSVDVWDASCSYSYVPNSACNVYAIYPGFGSVNYTSDGYPVLTTSNYLRVRYSVSGLNFASATLFIRARSYATSSSTNFLAESPIYGGAIYGPVDNDWVYDWYGIDWSAFLRPGDQPSLTAIQIYAASGSGKLAVRAVELCVQ